MFRIMVIKFGSLNFGSILISIILCSLKCSGANSTNKVNNNDMLNFENCTIKNLENIYDYYAHPTAIHIRHCSLQELPNALFIRFPNVTVLEITDSRIMNLQDYAFNGLRELHVLNLTRNNLTELKSWSYHNFDNMHTIDLRRNLFARIDSAALRRYPNLTKLNLAVNLLTDINNGTFKYNQHLKTINLGKNLFTRIEESYFKGLNKLVHLSMHYNNIKFIHTHAFATNSHLRSLRLEGNKISIIDSVLLHGLPRLIYLNISHNLLDTIYEHTFGKNVELTVLDMSFNQFVAFKKESFYGLQMLQTFNISHNRIEDIQPNTLIELGNLKYFDLSSNKISYLFNGIIDHLPKIELINLSRNAIEEIESGVFANVQFLTTLDLSYNRLFGDDFLNQIANLKSINISHNRFASINMSTLYGLSEISLSNNPWRCDWILMEIMRSHHENNILWGDNYIVKVQATDSTISIPDIDCYDNEGHQRNILMLSPKFETEMIESEDIIESPQFHNSRIVTSPTFEKILYDEFDFKALLLWTAIGVIAVFGGVKLGKMWFKRSERKSEEFRRSQQLEKNLLYQRINSTKSPKTVLETGNILIESPSGQLLLLKNRSPWDFPVPKTKQTPLIPLNNRIQTVDGQIPIGNTSTV